MIDTLLAPPAVPAGEIFSAAVLQAGSIDLSNVKTRLCDPSGPNWARHVANEVELEYRRFLIMNVVAPDMRIVPGKLIDDFWHYHILDTGAYATDCQAVLGRFLHHVACCPGGPTVEDDDRQGTLELYERLFPAWDMVYWTTAQVDDLESGPTTIPVPSECYTNPDM